MNPFSEKARTEEAEADATEGTVRFHADDVHLVRTVLERIPGAQRQFEQRLDCVQRMLRARNAQLGNPLTSQELPDLVQDTLAVIWRKLDEFQGRASLETWVYRICTFELMNAIRSKRRRIRHSVHDEDGSMDWVPARAEELPMHLRFEKLYQSMERIPLREEQILRLKHYEDRTFEDIGRELGMTPSGVKHHYYRAIRHLREFMTGDTGEGLA